MKTALLLPIIVLLTALSSSLAQPVYQLDPGFTPVVTQPGTWAVGAVTVQSDGSIYVAGTFAAIDGIPRRSLARIKATGGIDEGFAAPFTGRWLNISAVKLQPDGRLVVGGHDSSHGTNFVFRLNPDGSRDPGFLAELPANSTPIEILLQSDHKIVVGLRTNAVVPWPSRIIRLDPTGRQDSSFTPVELRGGAPDMNGMVLQPDGRILVWGYFTHINGEAHVGVARLDSNGSIDPTFRNTLNGVRSLAVLPDGKLFVSTGYRGNYRLNPNGSVDAACCRDNPGYSHLLVQTDGKIIASHGEPTGGFRRLDSSGHTDGSFEYQESFEDPEISQAWALLPDGGLLIQVEGGLKKLNSDGTLDRSFASTSIEIPGEVGDLIEQQDGKVVVTGLFERVNGVSRRGIARLNADGSLDPSFVPDAEAPHFAVGTFGGVIHGILRYQPWDGKLVVRGWSRTEFGRGRLVRLNPDGSLDQEFQPPEDFYWGAFDLQLDGSVYASHSKGVVRLTAYGSLDSSFRWEGTPTAIALQNDGRLLIGQSFSNRNPHLIRLNADGSPDTNFVSIPVEGLRSLRAQLDGKIVVASSEQIGRLNADGTWDSSFSQTGHQRVLNRIDDVALLAGNRIALFGDIDSLSPPGNQCLLTGCQNATFVILNSAGQFEGEVWLGEEVSLYGTRRALPVGDRGFLLAGWAAAGVSPYGLDLVRVDASPVIQSSQRNLDGSFGLRIGGREGWTYTLDASTNLVEWAPLRDLPSEGSSTVFTDPSAGDARRFYRAVRRR